MYDKNEQANLDGGTADDGAAAIGGALKLPLNKERLRKLTENYVVSNDKIKKALGIEKMPVTARDGMMKTLSSFNKE